MQIKHKEGCWLYKRKKLCWGHTHFRKYKMHKAKLIVPIFFIFNDTKFKLGTKIYSGLFAK